LDNYKTVDFSLNWYLDRNEDWRLNLIGKNIFDEKAFEPTHPLVPEMFGPISDYPIESRSLYIQLTRNL